MARTRGRAERDLPEAPPQNDAYTGLLAISLIATLAGLVFVALDYSDYSAKVPAPKTPASISQPPEVPPGGEQAVPKTSTKG